MLTRLRVQGFKSLLDVDVRFGPFTCIAGRNAVGKSNLFDAIRFLSLLTQHPITEAARLLRETQGRPPEPRSLFTALGESRVPEMRFTADLLIDAEVRDHFGIPARASASALRYEIALRLAREDGSERLELVDESLRALMPKTALEFPADREFLSSALSGARGRGRYISTEQTDEGPRVRVHPEGGPGRSIPAPMSPRTIVGGTVLTQFPTILAVHREMESWRRLLLEPTAMRSPSSFSDPPFLDARGANLPATIERLRKGESQPGQVYAELANLLSDLLDDIQEVRIRSEEATATLTLEVRGSDGVFHQATALSDGTLRFLALVTLALDPEAKGVLCIEEPENGIHPERIPALVRLLKDIAVDPTLPVGSDNPLRQVVVNTHSPALFSAVDEADLIVFNEQQVRMKEAVGRVTAVHVPPGSWRAKAQTGALPLAPGQVGPYLHAGGEEEREAWLAFFTRPAQAR